MRRWSLSLGLRLPEWDVPEIGADKQSWKILRENLQRHVPLILRWFFFIKFRKKSAVKEKHRTRCRSQADASHSRFMSTVF